MLYFIYYSTTLIFIKLVAPTLSTGTPAAITTVSPLLTNPFFSAISTYLSIISSVDSTLSATIGYTPHENANDLATFSHGVTAIIGHSGLH